MATLEEQETIITQNRADDYVSIYTSNTHDMAYFRKDSRYSVVKEWFDAETGDTEAIEFRIAKDSANIRKIAKRVVSDDQKRAMAERLNTFRNSN